MDAGRLHRLARMLRQVALAATAESGDGAVSAAVIAVVEDLAHHHGATVSEIATRTGLAQSQVSTTVAHLRTAGVITAEADPTDKRRALLSVAPGVSAHLLTSRAARPIESAMVQAHPQLTAEQLTRLHALLDQVADLLLDDPPAPRL